MDGVSNATRAPWLFGRRARVRTLFLRILGATFLVAFASVLVQIRVLVGRDGLLPACRYLDALAKAGLESTAPTLFWADCGDTTLVVAAVAGLVLSAGLILDLAPRYCLVALWALYLSFVTVGQDFFSFQWDNLLLESAFFALFITPAGWRSRDAPAPGAAGIFLMLWLLFRLNFESGVAKLASGDPTWRDLTALVSYYETAPLPTPLGWYAHQMPVWAHRASAGFSLAVELVGSLLVFATRPLRVVTGIAMVAMQLSILLTANYGFFNYLSLALCLFLLDDDDLAAFGGGTTVTPEASPSASAWSRVVAMIGVAVLVGLTLVPFMPVVGMRLPLGSLPRMLSSYRSINAYHLFAHMTLVRREAVIEGSDDGTTWLPYEFRSKPGDPLRPPPFVAPHQPRVDFQLWFLLLGGGRRAPYFDALLDHLARDPAPVADLFAVNPFPERPPRLLRVAIYRYRFTDWATGRATGAWWSRELLGYARAAGAGAS
jgi:hypothetical protein